MTFGDDRLADHVDSAFWIIEQITERHWGPEAATRSVQPQIPLEVITYVRSGRLHLSESEEDDRVLRAGEFERALVVPGRECLESNPSETHYAHMFRISLRLQRQGPEPAHRSKHFSEAQRKARTLLVASSGGEVGALDVASDVRLYSTLLYPGRRVVHEVLPGRAVWVHAVHGALTLGARVLRRGDGVGMTTGPVALTAREHSEILLIDVAYRGRLSANRSAPVDA